MSYDPYPAPSQKGGAIARALLSLWDRAQAYTDRSGVSATPLIDGTLSGGQPRSRLGDAFSPLFRIGDTIAPQTPGDRSQFGLAPVGPFAPQQNRFLLNVARPGDFSNGYHDLMRDTYYDYYKQHGYPVEREVRFNGLAKSGISSLVDLMVKTPNDRLAHLEEYKTGRSPTFTPAQAVVFPQIMYGHSESFDPKVRTFGLPTGEPLPPLDIYQIWAKNPGQPYDIKQLRPEIVHGWPNENPTRSPQRR